MATPLTEDASPAAHAVRAPAALGYFRNDCRLCHSKNLHVFLDFGMHPHSDGFVRPEALLEPEHSFPLACALCRDCGQVQITYVVTPEFLYGNDYLYVSSITETGRKHFLGMASSIVQKFAIPPDALAIDIGSNVGLLLSGFRENRLRVLGVDPAPKPAAIAKENGIDTVTELFSAAVAERIATEHGKAAVITGTNVCAHIDDMDDLMRAADILLEEDGVFIIEAPYWLELLRRLEYDTIYHQHLSYFSIKPMVRFCERFGMELFDVERTTIHGGSIRMCIGRAGRHARTPIVQELIDLEDAEHAHDEDRANAFGEAAVRHRMDLVRLLINLKDQGKSVVGISAPAKGSTLLNYCGINSSHLEFVTEKAPMKVGLFTPGTHIPIVADAALLERQPDYALILAWNFADEIMRNLKEYKARGGKFIIPIPSPTVV
jgi:SAM-dependent methyltransferase